MTDTENKANNQNEASNTDNKRVEASLLQSDNQAPKVVDDQKKASTQKVEHPESTGSPKIEVKESQKLLQDKDVLAEK